MEVRHLDQSELARRFGLTEATLERWRSEGVGPVFLKFRGLVRYRLSDVEAFEAQSLKVSTTVSVALGELGKNPEPFASVRTDTQSPSTPCWQP